MAIREPDSLHLRVLVLELSFMITCAFLVQSSGCLLLLLFLFTFFFFLSFLIQTGTTVLNQELRTSWIYLTRDFKFQFTALNYPATTNIHHILNGKGMIIPQCVTQHRTSCCFWYCHHQHMYLALLASSEDTVIDSKIFFTAVYIQSMKACL